MKPDAWLHDPTPIYLRELLDRAGISQRQAAAKLGVSDRMMRYYLADEGSKQHRKAPYLVQFGLECLADQPLSGK
nr:helix-turn-helix transcriptional regulator [Pseudomonas veronii]